MNSISILAITFVIYTLATTICVYLLERRIQRLESQLVVSEENVKDVEIERENFSLNDDQLESIARKAFGGGSKPPS